MSPDRLASERRAAERRTSEPQAAERRTDRHLPEDRRVVITGIGPVTAVGIGADGLWEGLRKLVSPVARITRFDPSPFRSQLAAEIHDFDPLDYLTERRARRLDRFGQFGTAAAHLAMKDAGLDPTSIDPDRAAVQMGSALGGLAHAQEQHRLFIEKGIRAVDPTLAINTFVGAASCEIAIELGFSGPNATNGMSCASATIAIGEGFRLIRDGQADVALTGGVEAPLASLTFGSFAIIRAMSTRNDDPAHACRPFDAGRDGFVMGEGAAAIVLESLSHARQRGARIYAEVAGYATTNDAYHMLAPRPDGSKAGRAMQQALDMAQVAPAQVDVISAHASSTPLNDGTESQAIRAVFGEAADSVRVTGTKPYHGHALGASGAIEVAIAALGFERGWTPPVLNLETPGAECDLNYITGTGLESPINTVLSNSFGFGGINGCLVLRRVQD